MSANLAVAGAGAWGTALAIAAAAAGHRVTLWARDEDHVAMMRAARVNARALPGLPLPSSIHVTANLADLAGAEAVLLVTPAQTTREMTRRLAPLLPQATPLVICAKGLERGTNLFLSEVAEEMRPGGPVAVLSGPGFAADVARGLPTAVTLACSDAALAERLANRLSGPALRVYHRTDRRGVEIGGAAKNVFAIACGAVMGRGLGESARAALIARGFAELLRFAESHGARADTLMGLSGLGDLVLSCTSPQSRNHAFGERLGRGLTVEEAGAGYLAEGALTAPVLVALARARGVEMPVAEAVNAVIAGRVKLDEAIGALLQRPLKQEG